MLASVLLCALVVCGSASAELTGMDVGTTWPPNPIGSLTIDTPGSDYTVQAAGRDIWDIADSFHYAYEPVMVTGDFEAIVRVDSLAWLTDPLNVQVWAKAGIMARANLMEHSAYAMVCRTGHNGVHRMARQIEGRFSITKNLGSGDVFGSVIWIKLARKGNLFAAWWADDNAGAPDTWQNPTVIWIDMPATIYLGLATTSRYNIPPNNLVSAIYRKFSVSPLADFPPLPNFGPFPGPEGEGGLMGIREVIDNGGILNQDDCNDSLTSGLGTIVDYTTPVLNITDSGPTGHFDSDDVFGVVTAGHRILGNVDDLSLVAKGTVEIPADGYYTFCLTTDDGCTLQFPGHDFTGIYGGGEIVTFANGNAISFWGTRSINDTFGVIHLPTGHHPFVLTLHERLSKSAVEFSATPGVRTYFDNDFLLVGSGDIVSAKPPVPNPPEINYGSGWPITMVYQPQTAGPNQSDELDSAIANVEAAWAGTLPGPNVVNSTAMWLNYEDPQASAGGMGGKGFPKEPFPGSNDGLNNDHFAMGAGTHTDYYSVIEDFEDGDILEYTIPGGDSHAVSAAAAHNGTYGLEEAGLGLQWIYRNDAAVQVAQGDTISYWTQVRQTRSYCGFGASSAGTYSAVAAYNSNQFMIQFNPGYVVYSNLASVPQMWTLNKWYRIEVDWAVGGTIIARLYDSDGVTLLNSVAAANNTYTQGGIAFRGLGPAYHDTITRHTPTTPLSTIMTVYDGGYVLTDQFDYWEDQSTHSYVATGQCSLGGYVCGSDQSLRIGNGTSGTGSARIIVSVTPGIDKLKLRYKAPWVNNPSDNALYIDGVNKGSIVTNACNWQEIIIAGMSAYTADGQVEIKITDEALGFQGDVQITYLEVYSVVLHTFMMYSDDSCQFRILDLEGNDPCDWAINSNEMPVGTEIVRLDDGTGFRLHGWGVDAKGTINLSPGDYEVQVMFNEKGGNAFFGLWCSINGSRIFLLGDSRPVPAVPEIHALELVCPYALIGDLNNDCTLNFLDIAMAAMNWLVDCTMNPGDPACIPK